MQFCGVEAWTSVLSSFGGIGVGGYNSGIINTLRVAGEDVRDNRRLGKTSLVLGPVFSFFKI